MSHGRRDLSEHVAIVGSREGADLEHVKFFVLDLYDKHPDSILVSGGASGVDKAAEEMWLGCGGQLISYRPKQLDPERYAVEVWELGGPAPRVYVPIDWPTFLNYSSACLFRDMLIAEKSKRLVAFFRRGRSRGTEFTAEHAKNCDRMVYEFEASA